MKRFKQPELHFDESELKTNLGTGNFIFVGSSCDMFAEDIPQDWIIETLHHCKKYDNKYFFQTKNPLYMATFYNNGWFWKLKTTFCITVETNRENNLGSAPNRQKRISDYKYIPSNKMITIEPIMDFDLIPFVEMIKLCEPAQVNIGANTMRKVELPEPEPEKVLELIAELEKFTKVYQKDNLKRLLNKK